MQVKRDGAPDYPPAFRPRIPWWGGDLQTIRNRLWPFVSFPPHSAQRLYLPIGDGSGDELAGLLREPEAMDGNAGVPLLVLIHGLAGSEDSVYMRASSAYHLRRGRRVLSLNLRGAGASRASCGGHYHSGCGEELIKALETLNDPLRESGLVLIGYSLGGNILINLLAGNANRLPILGAAAVSPPIEPAQAAKRLMTPRNRLYQTWLLRAMKSESLAEGARLSADERLAIAQARSVYEFDDRFIAPRNGYAGADDYYARTAGARVIGKMRSPLLIIHALDDPWIPSGPFNEIAGASHANIHITLPPSGGHVGFHARDEPVPWHDRYINAFLEDL